MVRTAAERVFPDISRSLHCAAVKVNDELTSLYRQKNLTPQDIETMAKLINILLLIRKSAPQLTAPTKPLKSSSDKASDAIQAYIAKHNPAKLINE